MIKIEINAENRQRFMRIKKKLDQGKEISEEDFLKIVGRLSKPKDRNSEFWIFKSFMETAIRKGPNWLESLFD